MVIDGFLVSELERVVKQIENGMKFNCARRGAEFRDVTGEFLAACQRQLESIKAREFGAS